MIIDDVDADKGGAINYSNFLGAVRQNRVSYRPYNHKLRHRSKGDTDQPFGATMLEAPWGTAGDVAGNEAALIALADGDIDEFRRAFRAADEDSDGTVNYEQFARALKVCCAHTVGVACRDALHAVTQYCSRWNTTVT